MDKLKTFVKNRKTKPDQKTKFNVLVMGLDSSGKTSMIYYIRTNEKYNIHKPTQGVDITNFVQSKRNIIFYDIGGSFESRKLYKYYKNDCDAVIYVIDSTDKQRLPYKKINSTTMENNGTITKGGDTIDIINNGTITDDGGAIIDDASPRMTLQNISIASVTSITSNESNTSLSTNSGGKSPDISIRASSTSIINNGFITATELKFDKPSPPTKKKSKSKNKRKKNKYKPSPPKIKPPNLNEYKKKKGLLDTNDEEKEGYNSFKKNVDNFRYTTIAAPLDPIKFDFNKVSTNKELISLLNYDISDNKIPFLIYATKQDMDQAMTIHEIEMSLDLKRIVNKKRQCKLIECNSFDHKNIKVGWFWLYKQLILQKPKKKKLSITEALSISDDDIVHKSTNNNKTVNAIEYNHPYPKCQKCKIQYRRDNGCTCVVCHKFYCSKDASQFMDHRKSGIKCKSCIGVTSKNNDNNNNTNYPGFIKFKRNKTFG